MKITNLFIDNSKNIFFNKYGYILIKNIISEEIIDIEKLYTKILGNKNKFGLFESTSASTSKENIFINENIKHILSSFIHKTFKDYSFYGGAFLVKSHMDSEELPLHQDWSIVNEKLNNSLFLWMPLQNVSKENGTIFLIPHSHLFFDNYRSGSYISNRINRYFIPNNRIITIELAKGDILIYSPALFHGSYKNSIKEDRIVSTSLITDKNAPFQYIHKKNENFADVYSINAESYLNDINYFVNGNIPPNAEFIKSIQYKHKKINALDVNKIIFKNFIQKIINIY